VYLLQLVHLVFMIGWKKTAHWKQTEHLLEHAWTHIIHSVLHVKLSRDTVILAKNNLSAIITHTDVLFGFFLHFYDVGFFDDGFLCISDLNSIPYRTNLVHFFPSLGTSPSSQYELYSSNISWDRWTSKSIFIGFFLAPSPTSAISN